MTTRVITANYGNHDDPPYPPVGQLGGPVEWLYFTDSNIPAPEPWQTHHVAPHFQSSNLSAKVFKAMPSIIEGDATDVIWIDANMQITDPRFVTEALGYVNDGVAFWAHPRRDCVYDEATVCLPGGKEAQDGRYRNLPIAQQMDVYREEGFPEHWGLYATGTTVWTPAQSENLGKAWLDECERWGFQDQLSLPVVAWRLGVEPGVFGLHQIERRWSTPPVSNRRRAAGEPFFLANRWLRIWPHAREPYV